MREMRRLDVSREGGRFQRLTKSRVRGSEISEAEWRRIERGKPHLVAADEDGVVALLPRLDGLSAHYGFSGLEAFRNGFPGLLEQATRAAAGEDVLRRIELWLTDLPNRPFIEPVLFGCGFELRDEWFEMVLAEVQAETPPPRFPRGYRLRPLSEADVDAFIRVSEAAYGESPAPIALAREYIATADSMQGVEAANGEIVAVLRLVKQPAATGYVDDLAVHPAHQKRGLGSALMRWALAWAREQGLRRARLHVRSDNMPALHVYRAAGFAVASTGLSYVRPLDEADVRKAREKRPGTYIKFGGWR